MVARPRGGFQEQRVGRGVPRRARWAGLALPPPVGFESGGARPALRRNGEIGLWQPRFWQHHIRDQADFDAHVRYFWGKTVKHGLVERPVDWLYWSIHGDISSGAGGAGMGGVMMEGEFGWRGFTPLCGNAGRV